MDKGVIIVYVVIILVIVLLFIAYKFIKKYYAKKVSEQKHIVDQHKMLVSIFVIEKKMGRITSANLPKAALDQVPKIYRIKKVPLVTAKIGPQVVTLICEEEVFKKLPDKKNVNIELAGIFIVSIKQPSHSTQKSKKKKK